MFKPDITNPKSLPRIIWRYMHTKVNSSVFRLIGRNLTFVDKITGSRCGVAKRRRARVVCNDDFFLYCTHLNDKQ